MTHSAFPALTTAQSIFKDLIWTPLILAGEASLFTVFPALNAPVLGTIDRAAISALSDWLFQQIIVVIDIESISFVNYEHEQAYATSSLKLKIVVQESGIGSDAYIQARDQALKDLAQFTHFSGG